MRIGTLSEVRAPFARSFVRDNVRSFANTVASWYDTGAPGRFVPTYRDWATSGALFQDSLGTQPVTALEQFVGLNLDRSRGLRMSDELSSGPWLNTYTAAFDTFTSSAPGAFVGTATSGKTSVRAAVAAPTVNTKMYLIEFTPTFSGMTSLELWFAAAGYVRTTRIMQIPTSGQKYTIRTVAPASQAQLVFSSDAAAGASLSVAGFTCKEIPGTHRIQPTSTSRPILTARKNRLLMTADLSSSTWIKRGAAASAPAVGPDGVAASASLLTNIGAAAANDVYQLIAGEPTNIPMAPGVAIKKVTTTGSIQINNAQNQANGRWTVDLALLGTDWETLTPTHPAVTVAAAWSSAATGAAGMQFSSLGGITASFYVGGIGLMRGTEAGRYQRVNTATDYDAVGFPVGLRYDGIDDCMYTAAPIDYSGTDKVTVARSFRKDSDAATGALYEHGPNSATTDGCFGMLAPHNAAQTTVSPIGRGTTPVQFLGTLAAPAAAVVVHTLDISGVPKQTLDVNGTQTTNSNSMGTGNFSSQVSYEGARANASFRFNGVVYDELQIGNLRTPDELAYVKAQLARNLSEALA